MIYKEFENEIGKLNPLFDSDKGAYRNAMNNLNVRFKLALFKEYEVEDNPKKERCWELAWEHGHSSGYSEIEMYFIEIVELIK